MPTSKSHLYVAVFAFLLPCVTHADDADTSRSLELFEKHVRPALIDQCIRCHGPEKQQGGLRLDSREWLYKGGDSGAVITPGDPADSILFQAVEYEDPALEMPPRGRLPEATIAAFKSWIELGAVDPRESMSGDEENANDGSSPPSVEEGRRFWAFQPLADHPVPKIADDDWSQTDIDRFVFASLHSAGLKPTFEADKETLLRRVYFDLTGLPPTADDITHFVSDQSPDAYANLVDRLLDSPQFGERWGRHWLDVVRFAESSGGGRTLMFPNAWRYRDYVIEALNADMPYDQFVREQIAGDLLPHDDWKDHRRKMTATAFLLLGPTNYELQDKDVLEMDVVDEQIDTIGKAMLGMTIGCARCHDHKFDPIPTEDYYALAGILKSTKAMIHSNVSTWNKETLPVSPEEEAILREKERAIKALQSELDAAKAAFKKLGGKVKDQLDTNLPRNVDSKSIEGIVVDDKQAIKVGAWTVSSSAPRYVDDTYIHDGTADKGKKRVVYRPQLEAAGNFEVRIAYSGSGNRSSRVPVHIQHSGGETVRLVDQTKIPEIDDAFTSLGIYAFDPVMAPEIVISTEGTEDGVVIADAVVLVPTDLPPLPTDEQVDLPENIPFIVQDASSLPGIVVDDQQAVLVGEWKGSVHTPPFVGAGYLHDGKEDKGKKSASFIPDLPRAGTYEVRVSHNTNVRRANGVPVTVRHAGGETTVKINEGEEAPINKLFRSLGRFEFFGRQGGQRHVHDRRY